MYDEYEPPHSIDAEQALLGILLSDNITWNTIADLINADDFYNYEHRCIYSAIYDFAQKNSTFDILTVSEICDKTSINYLHKLVEQLPFKPNLISYAEIIVNKSNARKALEIGLDINSSILKGEEKNVYKLIENAVTKLNSIKQIEKQSNDIVDLHSCQSSFFNHLEELVILRKEAENKNEKFLVGKETGFAELDNIMCGLPNGLITIGGRASMGKTAIALNIVNNIAQKEPVLIFSLETPINTLLARTYASLGTIPLRNIREGNLTEIDWQKMVMTSKKFLKDRLFINCNSNIDIHTICAQARALKAKYGVLGAIMVDYLQLINTDIVSNDTLMRTSILGGFTRKLKILGQELECPVLCLSQVNRAIELRPNKRPFKADFSESGSIENDSDVMLAIYRDEVYFPDTKDKGLAEIIMLKDKEGECRTIKLAFEGKYARFSNFVNKDNNYD